jgi:hypothetical protein
MRNAEISMEYVAIWWQAAVSCFVLWAQSFVLVFLKETSSRLVRSEFL